MPETATKVACDKPVTTTHRRMVCTVIDPETGSKFSRSVCSICERWLGDLPLKN